MSLPLLSTESASKDITSLIAAGDSYVAARDERISLTLLLSGLTATAANFDFVVYLTRGLVTYPVQYQKSIGKYADTDTVFGWTSEQIGVQVSDILNIMVLSSNAGDTAVTCVVDWYSCSFSNISVNAADIAGIVNLNQLFVDATGIGDTAVGIIGDTDQNAVSIDGVGTGNALDIVAVDGSAIHLDSTNAASLYIEGSYGIDISPNNIGISIDSGGDCINLASTNGSLIAGTAITSDGAIDIYNAGTGPGLWVGSGSDGGITVVAGGNSAAINITGSGTGDGVTITTGASATSSKAALNLIGQNAGSALIASGSSGSGDAVVITGGSSGLGGSAVVCTAPSQKDAVRMIGGVSGGLGLLIQGRGTGTSGNAGPGGLRVIGGSGGVGLIVSGGGSLGAATFTSGSTNTTGAVQIIGNGTNTPGFVITGTGTGDAILLNGGASGAALNAGGDIDAATITQIQSGLALTTDVTTAVSDIETYGGAAPWTTPAGFVIL